MIGNADCDLKVGRNVKYLIKNDKVIPIPYDFDFAGLVNASYAIPNPNFGISSVKERVFIGFKEDVENLNSTLAFFKTKRQVLVDTVKNFKLLDKETKGEIINYLDTFYASMNEVVLAEKNGIAKVAVSLKK